MLQKYINLASTTSIENHNLTNPSVNISKPPTTFATTSKPEAQQICIPNAWDFRFLSEAFTDLKRCFRIGPPSNRPISLPLPCHRLRSLHREFRKGSGTRQRSMAFHRQYVCYV